MSTVDQSSRWIASFGRRDAPKQRLLCLPYAGGSCTIFRNWSRVLPPDIEVLPVQLPGRGARHQERPPSSIEETSAQLSEAITPLLDRPYMIFGHCMGALIALELARFLDARSLRPPSALFVAARPEPRVLDFDPRVSGLSDPDLTQALRNLNSTPKTKLSTTANCCDSSCPQFVPIFSSSRGIRTFPAFACSVQCLHLLEQRTGSHQPKSRAGATLRQGHLRRTGSREITFLFTKMRLSCWG